MAKNVFNELSFDVTKEVFYEVLENQDKGFGFKAKLKFSQLSDLQIFTLDFLFQCYEKKLLGKVELTFSTEAIGEIKPLSRMVEKIEKTKDAFVISNSY